MDLDFHTRHGISDGIVHPVGAGDDTGSSKFGETISVDDLCRRSALFQEFVEALLEFGRDVATSQENDLQFRQIHIRIGLLPCIDHRPVGEQDADAILLDGLGVARIEGTERYADDLHA